MRVVVIDPHPLYRFALEAVFEDPPGVRLLGAYSDPEAALAAIGEAAPELAIVDLVSASDSDLVLLRRIRADSPSTRVLCLAGEATGSYVYECLLAGVSGFLLEDADRSALYDAIEAVGHGQVSLSPAVQAKLAEHIRTQADPATPPLSERELAVLRLASTGCSRREIGELLHLSPSTVKVHLSNAYRKLGVASLAAAVSTALRRGLLD